MAPKRDSRRLPVSLIHTLSRTISNPAMAMSFRFGPSASIIDGLVKDAKVRAVFCDLKSDLMFKLSNHTGLFCIFAIVQRTITYKKVPI